jgi:uncharacterized repeat protein (TIGR04138 family)
MSRRHYFDDVAAELAARDDRYAPEAFEFVQEALARTTQLIKEEALSAPSQKLEEREQAAAGGFHVTGQELLEGLRLHMLETYGEMARLMLERSGLCCTEDVGNVVFVMVEAGVLGKRDSDSIDDFRDGYEFDEAFRPGASFEV